MRPIDADALIAKFKDDLENLQEFAFQMATIGAINTVKRQPTIDAVPVVHGRWIEEWETEDTRMLRCSECRMMFNVGKGRDGNFCPNCGAKMDRAERKEE